MPVSHTLMVGGGAGLETSRMLDKPESGLCDVVYPRVEPILL